MMGINLLLLENVCIHRQKLDGFEFTLYNYFIWREKDRANYELHVQCHVMLVCMQRL